MAINVGSRRFGVFWWSHIVLFLVLFFVASVKTALGHADCGCVGPLSVPPWMMALVDGLVIVAIFWSLQFPTLVADIRASFRDGMNYISARHGALAGFIVAGGSVFAMCVFCETSDSPIANSLRGITIKHPRVRVGDIPIYGARLVDVQIRNPLPESIRILGGSASCRCVKLAERVTALKPNGETTIRFQVSGRQLGAYRQRYILYLNSPLQAYVNVTFVGDVRCEPVHAVTAGVPLVLLFSSVLVVYPLGFLF